LKIDQFRRIFGSILAFVWIADASVDNIMDYSDVVSGYNVVATHVDCSLLCNNQ